MQTFADLKTELHRYIGQTGEDVAAMAHLMTHYGHQTYGLVVLRNDQAAFTRRHAAAQAALAQLMAVEQTVLTTLLQEWATHTDAAMREIASNYQTDGTLTY